MAEKINKEERKGLWEIIVLQQGQETDDWWDVISSDCSEDDELPVIRHHIPADFIPFAPKLYRVGLGMGYLELPQVSINLLVYFH